MQDLLMADPNSRSCPFLEASNIKKLRVLKRSLKHN